MKTRLALLHPFWRSAGNRYLSRKAFPAKTCALPAFGLAICVALYLLSVKVVGYFHAQNELGIILSLKIFQMAWIVLFVMLVFSCTVSAVSALFLSQDNEIVFTAPVSPAALYFMRYWTTTASTAWMMIVFSLPIFAAYGRVFAAGPLYWPLLVVCLPATALTASALAMLLTILLVNLFPARRTRDIVLYLSLCFGIFIYVMFRLLRPEDLVNPDKFGHFIDYLSSISTPGASFMPAAWAANLLAAYLAERDLDPLLLALTLITPWALFFLGEGAMARWFFRGLTRAQESFGGFRRFRPPGRYRANTRRWIFGKEIRLFLRDSAEWSQLFMIAALIIVYLYNFKLLPVDRAYFKEEYLTNLISFLNIGLAGFIVASLAGRFVYPSIGAEGGAFYIVQTAPLAMGGYILAKYLFHAIPLTLLALLLVGISNHLLHITGPMWWFSIFAIVLITLTVVAMALGFGARHANFKAENRAAPLSDLGAILYLLSAAAFELVIIASGAYPVYQVVKTWLAGPAPSPADLALLGIWIPAAGALALAITRHSLGQAARHLQCQTR